MKKRITIFLGLMLMALAITACRGVGNGPAPTAEAAPTPAAEAAARPVTDREGYAITLPDEINTIISIGPANTEILAALGFGSKIISADDRSHDVEGITEGIAVLDMMALDAEFILDLNPDIIFITGMTRVHGEHPLQMVSNAGITLIFMPVSASIASVMEDIRFIAAVMGVHDAGEEIIAGMQAEIDSIRETAAGITQTRTVYFEISPAPWLYSFGTGTFLHEMIELAGGVNIFADHESWIPVTDEIVLELNPDVILTSTDFIDDPIGEIMGRPGWSAITAVQNGDVFQICANAGGRPSHNIVRALREIAKAVFPEYFQ